MTSRRTMEKVRSQRWPTLHISRQVALLGRWVEHLTRGTARLRGVEPVQTDVVEATVVRVGQGWVHAYRPSRTHKTIRQLLRRLPFGFCLFNSSSLLLLSLGLIWFCITVFPVERERGMM